jgi:hypothetical protein
VLGRGPRRCVDEHVALRLDGGDAGNGAQRFEPVGSNEAGEDADPGERGVSSKPEFTAGSADLLDALEGVVGDGDGDPDEAHGMRMDGMLASGTLTVPELGPRLHLEPAA